jgi:hypothetical protein
MEATTSISPRVVRAWYTPVDIKFEILSRTRGVMTNDAHVLVLFPTEG